MTITISSEVEAQLLAILEADTSNFVELGRIAGLDPSKDYRFANLERSDFSDCDIRSFDFTGADLTNSTGTNVVWDETTILTDADITGSIFEVKP